MQAQQNENAKTNDEQSQDTKPVDSKLGFRPNLTPIK